MEFVLKYALLSPAERCPESDDFFPILLLVAKALDARIVTRVDNIAPDEALIVSAGCGDAEQLRIARLPQLRQGRFVSIDHAFFGDKGIRGYCFRVVAGSFQPETLIKEEPNWQHYRRLKLPAISPWRHTPGDILIMPHTREFGALAGASPAQFLTWVRDFLPPHLNETDLKIRGRHATGARISPEDAVGRSRVVIGFNTELLLRAVRMGVPAIGHPKGSLVYAFNSQTPSDVDRPSLFEKTVEEREHLCATLATFYQASRDELEMPGFIQGLLERQLDHLRNRPMRMSARARQAHGSPLKQNSSGAVDMGQTAARRTREANPISTERNAKSLPTGGGRR